MNACLSGILFCLCLVECFLIKTYVMLMCSCHGDVCHFFVAFLSVTVYSLLTFLLLVVCAWRCWHLRYASSSTHKQPPSSVALIGSSPLASDWGPSGLSVAKMRINIRP